MLAKIAKADLLTALKEMPDDMNAAQLEALLASVAARAAALDPKTGEADEAVEPPSGEMDMGADMAPDAAVVDAVDPALAAKPADEAACSAVTPSPIPEIPMRPVRSGLTPASRARTPPPRSIVVESGPRPIRCRPPSCCRAWLR